MRAITAFVLWSGWAGLAFAGRPKPVTASQANPARPLNVLCLLPKGARELYNLEKDPNETNNAADDPDNAAVIRQLEQQLRAHMEEVGDPATKILRKSG